MRKNSRDGGPMLASRWFRYSCLQLKESFLYLLTHPMKDKTVIWGLLRKPQLCCTITLKGTVSRYIDKNRTGACGLGRNRRLLRHTELVFLSTVCARRVVLVLFTNMDAVN